MKVIVASLAAMASVLASSPTDARKVKAKITPEIEKVYLRMASGSHSLRDMVDCRVHQDPDGARRLFDLEMGSPAYNEASEKFFYFGGDCLWRTQRLATSNLMGLGYVAQRLIDMDAVTGPVRSAFPSSVRGGGTNQWTIQNLSPEGAMRSLPLAYCLMDRHGDRVAQIVATQPVSKEERDLFNSMGSDFSDCIPAGQTWILQPHIMRAALAIAYYRSSRTPAAGGSASNAQS